MMFKFGGWHYIYLHVGTYAVVWVGRLVAMQGQGLRKSKRQYRVHTCIRHVATISSRPVAVGDVVYLDLGHRWHGREIVYLNEF